MLLRVKDTTLHIDGLDIATRCSSSTPSHLEPRAGSPSALTAAYGPLGWIQKKTTASRPALRSARATSKTNTHLHCVVGIYPVVQKDTMSFM